MWSLWRPQVLCGIIISGYFKGGCNGHRERQVDHAGLLDWDDPARIQTWGELIDWIDEIGFLPPVQK